MLTTLLQPSGGQAVVCGFDVTQDADAVRKRIGYVMQEVTLDPRLTARQNLTLHANLYHLPRASLSARVSELLELVELAGVADNYVETFSGGMKKRLDLAAGLLHRPELLILDEPTLGLDVQSRHRLWDYIGSLREQGTTILLATNYLDEADRLCDRLIIIDHGRIVAEGKPEALRSSVGASVITLTSASDGQALSGILASEGGAERVVEAKDGVHVYVRDASAMLPVLIKLANAHGIALDRVTYTEPTLDDVFLLHTGRQLREGA
jgi:ABC-type multidrug transport system ATPase subunit